MKKTIKEYPMYGLKIVEEKFSDGTICYMIVDIDNEENAHWLKSYSPIPKDAEYRPTYEEVWIEIGSIMQRMDKMLDIKELEI